MQKLRTYFTPVLAMLLMVSSAGVTLNKHYCMGRLAEVSLFHKADNCAEKMGFEKGTPCPMDCCHDTSQHFEVDDYQLVTFQFDLDPTPRFILPIRFFELDEISEQQLPVRKLKYYQYSPPLISQDLPVLHESFLI